MSRLRMYYTAPRKEKSYTLHIEYYRDLPMFDAAEHSHSHSALADTIRLCQKYSIMMPWL